MNRSRAASLIAVALMISVGGRALAECDLVLHYTFAESGRRWRVECKPHGNGHSRTWGIRLRQRFGGQVRSRAFLSADHSSPIGPSSLRPNPRKGMPTPSTDSLTRSAARGLSSVAWMMPYRQRGLLSLPSDPLRQDAG